MTAHAADGRDLELGALRAENAELRAQLAVALARIEELERQLGQNSRNSSRPPSSDALSTPTRPQKSPTGRHRGAQPGHEAHLRAPIPRERVDRVIPVKPPACRRCGRALKGNDPAPVAHQVVEMPKIKPDVTQYDLHELVCPCCGERTRAELPEGVPRGAFGPRLQAAVGVCSGVYHMSKRAIQGFLGDMLGIEMSLGAIIASQCAASQALDRPVAEAREFVQQQPVKNADETGFRQGRPRAWLWVVVTTHVTVFLVHLRRSEAAARTILTNVAGVLGTDRLGSYNFWPLHLRQVCWAHLKRDFQAIAEAGNKSVALGNALLEETLLMFDLWHRYRDGPLARKRFQREMNPIRRRVQRHLQAGTRCGHAKTEGTCRKILKIFPALWTFVDVEGVEPTNNSAERALRPAVLWRKGSFGTQSEHGSRFVERIMTVATTLKQQSRNVLDFVTAACEARLHGTSAPSLLPDTILCGADSRDERTLVRCRA